MPITTFSKSNFLSTGQFPSKLSPLVSPQWLANPTEAYSETSCYTLTCTRICPTLLLRSRSLLHAANLAPILTMLTICPYTYRPASPKTFYMLLRLNRPLITSLRMASSPHQSGSILPELQATNVCTAEVAPKPFYTRHTGTVSSASHGNVSLISKPSAATSFHTGPLNQHTVSAAFTTISTRAY